MKLYNIEQLRYATEQSNLIEGEPVTGASFDNHMRATMACYRAAQNDQILHPQVLHSLVMEGLLPSHSEYRHGNVYVNTPNGQHHFPNYEHIPTLMKTWWDKVQDLHDNTFEIDQESVRWDLHAHYEAIHPHFDGNGRSGRLLLWNMDMLVGAPIHVIEYAERFEYYKRLEQWRKAGVPCLEW